MSQVRGSGQKRTGRKNPVEIVVKISNKGSIEVYNKETKKNVPFSELPEALSFAYVSDNYFLNGYHKRSKSWHNSTTYFSKKEEIRIFKQNEKEPIFKGIKESDETLEKIDALNLSTCMNLFGIASKEMKKLGIPKGAFCKIVLTPSGRNSFYEFLETLEDGEMQDFEIKGFDVFHNEDSSFDPSKVPAFTHLTLKEDQEKEAMEAFKTFSEYYSLPSTKEAIPTKSDSPAKEDDLPF